MINPATIREHMEVVGADGVHLGTVDGVEGDRIKLTRADSGSHAGGSGAAPGKGRGHHHYVSLGLVAAVEGNRVRLSASAANATLLEEEKGGEALADEHDHHRAGHDRSQGRADRDGRDR